MSVLLLDHDGLGTYNLAQYLGELDIDAEVYHSHDLSLDNITELSPGHIILSPSAATLPAAVAMIQHLGASIPILGVGLGFIATIQACGGSTSVNASLPVAKPLGMCHANTGVFNKLPSPFTGVCYQCQTVSLDNLPKMLDITAWLQSPTDDRNVIVAVKHQKWPLEALLFHPEAMLSQHGHAILRRFLACHS